MNLGINGYNRPNININNKFKNNPVSFAGKPLKDTVEISGKVEPLKRDVEVDNYVKNSRLLSVYDNMSEKYHEFFNDIVYDFYLNLYQDERLNQLDNMNLREVKELEKTCEEIEKRYKELGYKGTPETRIKILSDLRYFDNDAVSR